MGSGLSPQLCPSLWGEAIVLTVFVHSMRKESKACGDFFFFDT